MNNLAHSNEKHERIYDFMHLNPVGVLTTVDSFGQPHGSVIYYHVAEDFSITFITKHDTRKHENLKHSPKLMLVIFEPASQTVVQAVGSAEILDEPQESNEVYTQILEASMRTSMAGLPPISKLEAGNYVTYKIRPTEIRMAVFARPDSGGSEMFETVDLPGQN